jgi:hypothetical protein
MTVGIRKSYSTGLPRKTVPIADRIKIKEFLDTVIIKGGNGYHEYKEGWDDVAVASHLSGVFKNGYLSPNSVAYLRMQCFPEWRKRRQPKPGVNEGRVNHAQLVAVVLKIDKRLAYLEAALDVHHDEEA